MLVTNQRDRDVTWMLRIELIFCNIVFEKILSDQFFVCLFYGCTQTFIKSDSESEANRIYSASKVIKLKLKVDETCDMMPLIYFTFYHGT